MITMIVEVGNKQTRSLQIRTRLIVLS